MFTSALGDAPMGSATPGYDSQSPAAEGPVSLPNGEVLRSFDLHAEDVGRLIELKEAVYNKPVDRAAFDWEYFRHPRSQEIRVFVVELERELVAATTRLPATFRLEGEDRPAFFNIDSMVHPDHRRKGRMRDLYQFARSNLPASSIGFSKGSSSQIYPLLLSIGHQEILPNTHLVSYPSATRWLMSRLRLRSSSQQAPVRAPPGFEDFQPIERFGADFDAFFQRVFGNYSGIFVRDAAHMNWRYLDIPHRRYLVFQRIVEGRTSAVVILAVHGEQAQIVDVLWDPEQSENLERCVRFAQACFDEHQVVRVACFATHPGLRDVLGRSGFLDRGETPRFSAYVPAAARPAFAQMANLHVVDGDGDTEFS
jgi:hypothetical protein